MKNLKLIIIAAFIAPVIAFAQTKEVLKKKKYKITNVYLLPSGIVQTEKMAPLSDFQKLLPNSTILKQSFDGYQVSAGGTAFNPSFTINLGINKYNAEKDSYKFGPEYRIGFSYNSANIMNANYYKEEKKRIDTLTSSQTGYTVYADSVTRKNCSMSIFSQQIKLDASLIFRMNPEARWSLYGGIGFNLGTSLNAYATVNYYEYSTVKIADEVNYSYSGLQKSNVNEYIQLKNHIVGSVYFPLGFDYRLANKSEFFKRIHLFGEFRPFINQTEVAELEYSIVNVGITAGLGLRVNF